MKRVRNLWLQDKKGVSLMIGYVLLVIIAIGLSVAVFAFLKLYVPPGSPECPEEVKLTIEDYSCTGDGSGNYSLEVTFANKGLLRVYGVYIRLGAPDRTYKPLMNTGERLEEDWGGDLFFIGNDVDGKPMNGYLNPYNSAKKPSVGVYPSVNYTYGSDDYETGWTGGLRELEIEPIYLGEEDDNQASVCETAIVKKIIDCQ